MTDSANDRPDNDVAPVGAPIFGRREILRLPVAAALLSAGTAATTACKTSPAAGTSLGTPDTRDVNRQAIAVFNSPKVLGAHKATAALFAADRNHARDGQSALIRTAADAHVFYATQVAVLQHRTTPELVWSLAPTTRWTGMTVPDSRFGVDNPDNAYRISSIDPAEPYRIRGRFTGSKPTDFTISALPKAPGDGIMANSNALIGYDSIDIDESGNFTVVLDASATGDRRNHLDITNSRFLLVRSTMGDWSRQRPGMMSIERLSDTPASTALSAGVEDRAASLGLALAENMLMNLQHKFYERNPVNVFPEAPVGSGAYGGLPTQAGLTGTYQLSNDGALLIDADTKGSYLGSQICDIWMLSYPYWHGISSLNNEQAAIDSDGRMRLVISAQDPGVHNWLDSGGIATGTLTLRWQRIPATASLDASAVTIRRMPLARLGGALPAGTRHMTGAERARQRMGRTCDFSRRLA